MSNNALSTTPPSIADIFTTKQQLDKLDTLLDMMNHQAKQGPTEVTIILPANPKAKRPRRSRKNTLSA